MKKGKIVKGIAGFYYVYVAESGIYECKAKGLFRKQGIKPFVGDNVQIDVISEAEKTGNVVEILPRKNALIRPAVANIDQALVIFAAASPEPNLNLLDRFLVMMEQQQVPAVICFNKTDLVTEEQAGRLQAAYEGSGYPVFFFSAERREGIERIRQQLSGRTSTVAGPSGVGKSTLINLLIPEAGMETGTVSEKIQRGKHTTRHSELLVLDQESFIFDTPGFSSLSVDYYNPALRGVKGGETLPVEERTLCLFFPEIARLGGDCRFTGCSHISEPDCAVKQAVAEEKISRSRYENYVQIYEELKAKKKY